MSAPVLNIGAVVLCAHGGQVKLLPNPKIMLSGQPAAQFAPTLLIAGCMNPTPPANTGPDVMVAPMPPSLTLKVTSNGQPLLLQTITGIPVPSGIPLLPAISAGQMKVIAS
jgi:hypothetical protein